MNPEAKRLAIIATFCFFPTALAGWWLYPQSEKRALKLFRFSIYVTMTIVMIAGLVVVTKGGLLIKPMGSFF
jgi:cytochrome b561